MNKKGFVKWSVLILSALIYLSIAAIPVYNSFSKNASGALTFKMSVGNIVVLAVLGVILVAVVVLALKNRTKVNTVMREYESEIKRITWFPWKDTKKSTIVALIALVACAVVIGLLDFALAKGILAFIELF